MNYRGIMIQAPMGSGKSHFVNNNQVPYLIDGDELLEHLMINNKNYFWYDYEKKNEREKILNVFEQYLKDGYWIMYSGHPNLIHTDVLILPDKQKRWQMLQNRKGFIPTKYQFEREQEAYEKATQHVPVVINGDIPSLNLLQAIYEEIKYF